CGARRDGFLSAHSAWVVGASTGIGRELALALADGGWRVAVSARSADKLEALAAERPDQILPVAFDVNDADAAAAAAATVRQALGTVERLVIGAAYWRMGNFDETTVDDLALTLSTNVVAPFRLLRLAVDTNLIGRGSRVALLSSVAGFNGLPNAVAYGTSKAALTHLAEALRFDLDPRGIGLSVVHPGFVDTPMTADNPFPMPFIVSAAEAARRILDGLDAGRFEIAFPRRFVWLLKLLRHLPYALSYPLIRRMTGADRAPDEVAGQS
ncbi:MAG: SDR family NAD(P)-dependent oxidoreductase, partial [Gammaproteobacteria bacterium]